MYPVNRKQIELRSDVILLELDDRNILIESGLGKDKFTDKQKRNFGLLEESSVEESLAEKGLKPEDIDTILMTHLHFDHACGLSKYEGEKLVSAFPNATNLYNRNGMA